VGPGNFAFVSVYSKIEQKVELNENKQTLHIARNTATLKMDRSA